MISYDLERAKAAVEYLVHVPYFPHKVRGLRTEVKRKRALPYKDEAGDAEVLNELLVIGRQNEQAMENLIAVAAFKRDQDRNAYQRQYMAAQRRRFKIAVELEERRTGAKLGLDERNRLAHEVQAIWLAERDEYVERRAAQWVAQHGGEISYEDKRLFIEQFWDTKNQELQAMLSEIPNESHVIRKRRRTVTVAAPASAVGQALQKAIDSRK
jgi:hypothetical protein